MNVIPIGWGKIYCYHSVTMGIVAAKLVNTHPRLLEEVGDVATSNDL